MGKFIDLTGQRFGRLTVIKRSGNKGKDSAWLCVCACGNEHIVSTTNLKNGHSTSCGCLKREYVRNKSLIHGQSNTHIYYIWATMIQRCTNPKCKPYEHYGARGITVCEEWRDFNNFYKWSISSGYQDGLSIERIDVDGNYSPQNCEWICRGDQQRNKRNNHLITYDGKTQTVSQWAEERKMPYWRLYARLTKSHWSIEKALTTP